MAKYYMNGYTPPEGVNSASKVKEYQRQLGVKADGIWGPDTDAAYRASLNRSAQRQAQSRSGFDWGDSGRNEAFDGYYNAIRNSLSFRRNLQNLKSPHTRMIVAPFPVCRKAA